jgi:primosomal protein N'
VIDDRQAADTCTSIDMRKEIIKRRGSETGYALRPCSPRSSSGTRFENKEQCILFINRRGY